VEAWKLYLDRTKKKKRQTALINLKCFTK
jgi:hypothetical protein